MGFYINPSDMTKEEFLAGEGTALYHEDVKNFNFSGDHLPVCLTNNGAFTAAGIAYCPHEAEAFLDNKNDPRPKLWFSVSRQKLKPYYSGK